MENLNSVELNIEKGIFKVNEKNLSNVSCFNLHFENGMFTLTVGGDYYATGKIKAPDKASAEFKE